MTADAILGAFDFYRQAAPESRAQVAAATTPVSLRKGATFYREGDVCQHFALVGHGDIRVFKGAATVPEITLYHVRDGEPCLLNRPAPSGDRSLWSMPVRRAYWLLLVQLVDADRDVRLGDDGDLGGDVRIVRLECAAFYFPERSVRR